MGEAALDLFGGGSWAEISDCGRYRYELTRCWGPGPLLEFIMLNPSTADASDDDPTIRRCIAFAKRWGFGGIVVRNLFAYRSTDPRGLVEVDDPIGPLNRSYLARPAGDLAVAAWGSNPAASHWWHCYGDITDTLRDRELWCLGTNGNGSPKHPLYVGAATPLRRWHR